MLQVHLTRVRDLTIPAFSYWGLRAQVVKTIEECAELSVQLCKWINISPRASELVGFDPKLRERLLDETADALIMLNQMRIALGEADVDMRIEFKIQRTEKILKDLTADKAQTKGTSL